MNIAKRGGGSMAMLSVILLLVSATGAVAAEKAECRCRRTVSFQPLPAATLLLSAVANHITENSLNPPEGFATPFLYTFSPLVLTRK